MGIKGRAVCGANVKEPKDCADIGHLTCGAHKALQHSVPLPVWPLSLKLFSANGWSIFHMLTALFLVVSSVFFPDKAV